MLYVLVGPDGKVYERTVGIYIGDAWDKGIRLHSGIIGLPKVPSPSPWMADRRQARRLGWRIRKCHIILDD